MTSERDKAAEEYARERYGVVQIEVDAFLAGADWQAQQTHNTRCGQLAIECDQLKAEVARLKAENEALLEYAAMKGEMGRD